MTENKELWELEGKLREEFNFWTTTVTSKYMGQLPYHLIVYVLETQLEKIKARIKQHYIEREKIRGIAGLPHGSSGRRREITSSVSLEVAGVPPRK